ncbi:MAG: ATP-binding protein [Phycisphaerae bacterium]|nr:ATP-binding protein [Phycisphaerae bacterium]
MTSLESMTAREQELGAILLSYNDVTERLKQAYESLSREVSRLHGELAAKNRELARRERLASLGQLAAGLAHEIRNPLGGISLYASVLEQELAAQPATLELARKIGTGVRTLNRLVNEILEFSQEPVLEVSWCTANEVIEPTLEQVGPWLRGGAIEVVCAESSRRCRVYIDALRLQRVLMNLLLNAIQAVGDAGTIGIEVEPWGAGGARWTVWDSGCGIPEERIEQIFDPFFTTRPTGTGLGLAIVHQIVAAHGGTIRARNRAGGGVQFRMEFPGADECGAAARPGVMEMPGDDRSARSVGDAGRKDLERKAS